MKQVVVGIVCAFVLGGGAYAQSPSGATSFEEAFMAASAEWYRGTGAAWGGEEALSAIRSNSDVAACRILTDAVARENKAAAMFGALPSRPVGSAVPQSLVDKTLGELVSMKRTERMRDVACGTK